jgi:hypothetical protein
MRERKLTSPRIRSHDLAPELLSPPPCFLFSSTAPGALDIVRPLRCHKQGCSASCPREPIPLVHAITFGSAHCIPKQFPLKCYARGSRAQKASCSTLTLISLCRFSERSSSARSTRSNWLWEWNFIGRSVQGNHDMDQTRLDSASASQRAATDSTRRPHPTCENLPLLK